MMTGMRIIYAAGFAALVHSASVTATAAPYSVCAPANNIHRQHVVCGATGCPSGEVSIFSSADDHPMCGGTQKAQAPAAASAPRSCGRHWSGWERRGSAVDNPCPSGCKRESKLRGENRGSGRRAEHRELWQCTGTPR
jgi:hypothetical protein